MPRYAARDGADGHGPTSRVVANEDADMAYRCAPHNEVTGLWIAGHEAAVTEPVEVSACGAARAADPIHEVALQEGAVHESGAVVLAQSDRAHHEGFTQLGLGKRDDGMGLGGG